MTERKYSRIRSGMKGVILSEHGYKCLGEICFDKRISQELKRDGSILELEVEGIQYRIVPSDRDDKLLVFEKQSKRFGEA